MDDNAILGFPLWVRLTHFFNFLFLSLLVRSGIEIIGAHPKFYWNSDALPDGEWKRFTKKKMPEDKLWTAEDEIEPMSSWAALPGKNNLGLGRHWHFWSVVGWLVTGVLYVLLLFVTPQWQRLVPTSWDVFPQAWNTLLTYLSFEVPPPGNPYNPLQLLTYFAVIFILTPLQILTGIAMSPALAGRFPWFSRMFGGFQAARSLHFISLVAFLAFFVIHIIMVLLHGFGTGMAKIVLGGAEHSHALAIVIGLLGIAVVVGFNMLGTRMSLDQPMKTKKLLQIGLDPLRKWLFHHWPSRQNHQHTSAYARVNGRPPKNETYQQLVEDNFQSYHLEVSGLVETPLRLSLEEVRQLPRSTHRSIHICIQGWTYFAEWGGVPISALLERCRPLQNARYLVFKTLDEKWEYTEAGSLKNVDNGYYYEVIDMELARRPQTILAYEMNGAPLPIEHGAPLRLRVEGQFGYKMAKWVCGIELVEDFSHIGKGQGGWRDDVLHYFPSDAGI